jgi:hypothetical protein
MRVSYFLTLVMAAIACSSIQDSNALSLGSIHRERRKGGMGMGSWKKKSKGKDAATDDQDALAGDAISAKTAKSKKKWKKGNKAADDEQSGTAVVSSAKTAKVMASITFAHSLLAAVAALCTLPCLTSQATSSAKQRQLCAPISS